MTISVVRLAVTGPEKPVAAVNFSPGANIVLGPSDTGKSYIVGCLKYALGSDTLPKEIPFASGYDRLALQFTATDGESYTIFRSLSGGESLFYVGCHDVPPKDINALKDRDINDFIVKLLGLEGKHVIISGSKKGNVTAGDLRQFSFFTEGETLGENSFLGSEVVNQTRRRSALFMMMTGMDDSAVVLGPNKDERLSAKGQVLGLDEAILALKSDLPEGFNVLEVQGAIERIDEQVKVNQALLHEHSAELNELRSKLSTVGKELLNLDNLRVAALETLDRFRLLDNKYQSDLERLQLIRAAASVFDAFAPQPCPLCHTPVIYQSKALDEQLPSAEQMALATNAEYQKIEALRLGLKAAMVDVETELASVEAHRRSLKLEQEQLARRHAEIVKRKDAPYTTELAVLTERHSAFVSQLKTYERLMGLIARRNNIELKTKKAKVEVKRNASKEVSALVDRIQDLLSIWGLDEAKQVSFDESSCDLRLMERPRLSYGKGKRAIFLAAYSIALMEHALHAGTPHFGLVVIDSPVLTYRDPKYGRSGEVISEKVADRFFNWMADWKGPGQLVVLENEEPHPDTLTRISHTIFVGPSAFGRWGFYP